MTPVALSPLNPAARIRNSQTDPDLRVKRGKFYKITGHLRNYTFHGMLVAFHWWPTTIPSVAILIPSVHHPPSCCSIPSSRSLHDTFYYRISSPSKKERKKINRKDERFFTTLLLSVIDDHFFFLFHFSRRLKRCAQLSRS